MLLSSQVTIRQKLGILGIFSVAMGCQIMSNFGAGNYGIVLGMALTEKYTAPFSKRQVRLRQLELENYFEGEFDSLAYE